MQQVDHDAHHGLAPTRRRRVDLLITGFGAFPGVRHNPSAEVARAIAGDRCWKRLGRHVEAEILHVGYASVETRLSECAANPPRALLMFGVAARRRHVTPELFALNRVSRRLRDASKVAPQRGVIAPGGPAFLKARADVRGFVRMAREAKCPARLSRFAGRYVCNFALWHGLNMMPGDVPVAFVHIPMPRRPAGRKRDSRPDLAAMVRAGKAMARFLLRQSLSRESLGRRDA